MKSYVSSFCQEFDYPAEAREVLLSTYTEVMANRDAARLVMSALLLYEKRSVTPDWKRLSADMDVAAHCVSVSDYTVKLLLLILMTMRARKLYREAGIPDEVFHNSFLDLRYKLFECHRMYGIWGTFVFGWDAGWYDLTRFALGRLQFELRSIKCDIDTDGIVLKEGDPVINTHIPSSGPLNHEAVLESYDRAAEFFGPQLAGRTPVIRCESWLLSPAHRVILPPTSNIRRFAEDYSLYETGVDEHMGNLWRIFYDKATLPPSELPRTTGLERAYADLLLAGELPGWGEGVLIPPSCR